MTKEELAELVQDAARWRMAVELHVVPKYVYGRKEEDGDESWSVEEYLDGVIAGTIKP